MKKIPAHTTSSPPRRALVYRIVFERAIVRAFVVILLCSFSLQTVERSFAYEEVATPPPESLVTVTDDTLAVISSEIEERSLEQSDVTETVEAVNPPTVDEPVVGADTPVVTEEVSVVVEPLETGGSSETLVEQPLPPTDDLASTTEEIDYTVSSTASTTELAVPTLTVESDQMIQFEKTNCLAVEDGSFYCQMASTTEPVQERGLFALPDIDGDLEIFVKDNDELTQVTFNTVDDASPYYDPASDTLVWHRMIDERYQIIVHDVASGEEVQLTDTSTNNMEPFRADNIIVWQHWANDAWQIMMYDGSDITVLTATTEHNLAPVVRNNLVVWHRVMFGEKTIEVYDLDTKSYLTIKDDNGGTISNPRMVLVYDAAMDNGDIVTRGYDLVTGEITSFAAEPAPLPDEIPEPDATGETRALLNAKSTTEEETTEDLSLGTDTSSAPVDPGIATTTSTGLTLDLREATSTTPADLPVVESVPDLIIEAFVDTASPAEIPVVE
jgi:hypothetical protein